jgi:putative zinc finger protein
MKQETDNEMDLLLRRLGRRPDIPLSGANGDVNHLDADELNAYAENVLPAAARARYTTHLAECARCRELVVQLSAAAGVVPVVETTAAAGPSGLKRFLASLFSPMVLRYAVPALGLIVVAAIGLFVLQQRQGKQTRLAQLEQAPTQNSITKPEQPPASNFSYDSSQAETAAAKPAKSSGSPENKPAAVAAKPEGGLAGDLASDTVAKKTDQPVTAEPPPAPKPTAVTDENQQAAAEARKEAPPSRVAQAPTASVNVTAADKVEQTPEAASVNSGPAADKRQAAPRVGALAGAVSAGRSKVQRDDAAEKEKDQNEAETRTVAGRRFRKQGGVWVDTAYNFSRSATTLTRGSEQYRALIADEPDIKAIADALDGEVLVVWKGRPYRIK